MEPSTMFAIALGIFIANIWIMYEVIKSATKSERILKLQEAQIKVLASIALKLGVDKEDLLKDTRDV